VLQQQKCIAFLDVRGFFDAKGNLKPFTDLTPAQAAPDVPCFLLPPGSRVAIE
jgi:hypothetical protein